MLTDVPGDPGYPYFHPPSDLRMLVAFLSQFEHLGWLPPLGSAHRQLLAHFGIVAHEAAPGSLFYEFCSQGARGEREPWLTIFFHLSRAGRVRICGILPTPKAERHRNIAVEAIRRRVLKLERCLARTNAEE